MTSRARFLFVDDEELVLRALQRTLARLPIDAQFCANPHEALDIIKRDNIEVVVSDLTMPGMSGIELLQQVRLERPLVTRILASGNVDRAVALRAVNEGRVSRIIEKPWMGAQLCDELLEVAAEIAMRRASPPVDAQKALKSFAPLFR